MTAAFTTCPQCYFGHCSDCTGHCRCDHLQPYWCTSCRQVHYSGDAEFGHTILDLEAFGA